MTFQADYLGSGRSQLLRLLRCQQRHPVNLGTVSLSQNATGYDSGLAVKYLLSALETDADGAADSAAGAVEATAATKVVVTL